MKGRFERLATSRVRTSCDEENNPCRNRTSWQACQLNFSCGNTYYTIHYQNRIGPANESQFKSKQKGYVCRLARKHITPPFPTTKRRRSQSRCRYMPRQPVGSG